MDSLFASNMPAFRLKAVKREDLYSQTKVFHDTDVEYFLFVEVPTEFAKRCQLYKFSNVTMLREDIDFTDIIEHDTGRIWYRVKFGELDQTPGHHVYSMEFVDIDTGDTFSLFFAYVLVANNPEKPYVYMKNQDKHTTLYSQLPEM